MNVPDSNDVTPIHVAAGCHNYSFCYFLIQSGCCVLIKDVCGGKKGTLFFFF